MVTGSRRITGERKEGPWAASIFTSTAGKGHARVCWQPNRRQSRASHVFVYTEHNCHRFGVAQLRPQLEDGVRTEQW